MAQSPLLPRSTQTGSTRRRSKRSKHPSPRVILARRDAGARAEVDALLRAAATLGAEAAIEDLLKTLVEQAAGLLDSELARFVVGSAERLSSNVLWRSGTWVEDQYDGDSRSASGRVWRSGRPYRNNNPATDPEANHPRLASYNVRSLLVVPLISDRRERLGILIVANSRRPDGFSEHDEQLLTAFCRFASIILLRARSTAARSAAEDKAARRGHEVDALLRAAATLGAEADIDELLKTLVEQAAGLLDVELARFVIGSPQRFFSDMLWRNGTWVEDLFQGKPAGPGSHVWRTRVPYRSNDPAADPGADRARLASRNIRSLLVVPLVGGGNERLGVLIVANSRHPNGFSDHDEQLLTAFCRFASIILLRAQSTAARLAAEQQAARRRREVEALLEAADRLNSTIEPRDVLLRIVGVAAKLFDVSRVNIITNEGAFALLRHTWHEGVWHEENIHLPLDASMGGWVIQHSAPYRSDDLGHDPLYFRVRGRPRQKTLLSVPITGRDGQVLGALSVCDRRDGAPFSDDDLRLAEGIAHHVAGALERATLTGELQRSTRAVALLEERERIAMDLHDGAIQSLYGVVLGLGAQMRTPGHPQPTSQALTSAMAQISGVIQEMRSYITQLRSEPQAGAHAHPWGRPLHRASDWTRNQAATAGSAGRGCEAAEDGP